VDGKRRGERIVERGVAYVFLGYAGKDRMRVARILVERPLELGIIETLALDKPPAPEPRKKPKKSKQSLAI
jgi:hypothetical protein